MFYKLAPLSFIGGSLIRHGGQNPIEAIKLGSGILSGPHTFNFAETYTALQRYQGFRLVSGPEELAAALKWLFENPQEVEAMKLQAAAAIDTLGGALEKTLEALKPYLPAPEALPATRSGTHGRACGLSRPLGGMGAGFPPPPGGFCPFLRSTARLCKGGSGKLRLTGAKLPVICVGNFTVGGAGKTPVALKLASMLRDEGRKPGFLTRGFGGNERGPHLVDPVLDDAARAGDEPLLLAQAAAAVVSRDRPLGARLLETLGLDTIIMDDGFQNPSLKKDFSLIVIDAGRGNWIGARFSAGAPARPARLSGQHGGRHRYPWSEDGGDGHSDEVLEQINGVWEKDTPHPALLPQGERGRLPEAAAAPSPLAGEGRGEGAFFARGKNVFEASIVPLHHRRDAHAALPRLLRHRPTRQVLRYASRCRRYRRESPRLPRPPSLHGSGRTIPACRG